MSAAQTQTQLLRSIACSVFIVFSMALSTFWTACLSDWTHRQVVTCVGGLLYLTTGRLVVMSVIYVETQKMSTIVASHVELWMGWMNQDPCSCFCRHHTQIFDWLVFWMTDSLTEPLHWQSVWPVQNMLCMRLETQRDCCVFCTSSSSSQEELPNSAWVLEHTGRPWSVWTWEKGRGCFHAHWIHTACTDTKPKKWGKQ